MLILADVAIWVNLELFLARKTSLRALNFPKNLTVGPSSNTILQTFTNILMEKMMADICPRIKIEYQDEATIVEFTDDKILEEKDIRDLDKALSAIIGQATGINMILDFSNVKFLSSAVLGMLIRLSKRIYENEGQLALCGINPKIYEIFKITRLNKVFDIYKNIDAAIDRLAE